MPKIIQLDRHVADLIAAGEVVERPASAAKELVENAVDAGATQVTVEIHNGGMTYLRVTDNGCGMEPEDAETAFLRHATSKIRTQEDLAAIGTLGFRGEALAAIASVSRIDLLTKTAHGEGYSLSLEAGRITDRGPAGCPDGTTIVIRDLFYNTPARMKFMKRDSVESSHVAAAVQKQALAHPDVAFRLIKDGETLLQTSGNGDLHGTVYQVFGRQLAVDMVPVKSQWEGYRLTGYVTKPTATRGNRNYQQFFVAGRPVRSKLLTAALEQAYENQIMSGRFPSCVLQLDLPRHLVDVNVHPAKTEVKFASEKAVFDAVYYGVLSALNKTPARPRMELPKAPKMENGSPQAAGSLRDDKPQQSPVVVRSEAPVKKQETFRTMTAAEYRTFSQTMAQPPKAPIAPPVARAMLETPVQLPKAAPKMENGSPQGASALRDDKPPKNPVIAQSEATRQSAAEEEEIPVQTAIDLPKIPDWRVVGEVLDTYIIVEQAGEVLFIDKHAAHERINFEKLKAAPTEIMSQMLMVPLTASLTREETAAVLENRTLLAQCGFEVEEFGTDTLLLRQIPSDVNESAALETLETLAGDLLDGKRLDPGALRDKLLHTIACKSAIKAGWHTDPVERDALVRQVLERDDIKYCPHGRPVCITLTKSQLERQFKR
jgi:DNA mismatch repair protein MutL